MYQDFTITNGTAEDETLFLSCYTGFLLFNTGTAPLYLEDGLQISPGQSFEYEGPEGYKLKTDKKISFSGSGTKHYTLIKSYMVE
jgi:hypothetical protein